MFGNHGNSSKKPPKVHPAVVARAKRELLEREYHAERHFVSGAHINLAHAVPQGVC